MAALLTGYLTVSNGLNIHVFFPNYRDQVTTEFGCLLSTVINSVGLQIN